MMTFPVEGASERFRRSEHGIVRRALGLVHSLVATAAPPMHGFDIYHGNQIVDASKIPAYPFALHKISEGATYQDPFAASRLAMFTQQGIERRSGYHWLRSDSSLRAQFDNYRRGLQRAGLLVADHLDRDVFVTCDWERTYVTATKQIPDPPAAMVEDWCGLVEDEYGDRQCVYSADWVTEFRKWRAFNPGVALWYAGYNLSTGGRIADGYGAMCWQFSSKVTVPGFATPVDGNTIRRQTELDRICGRSTKPPQPPVIVAPPVPALVWPAAQLPPKGDLMFTLVKVRVPGSKADPIAPNDPARNVTFGATFGAIVDSAGIIPTMQWYGPGSDPKVQRRMRDLNIHTPPVGTTIIELDSCLDITLEGPMPFGDSIEWSEDRFGSWIART